MKNEKMSHHRKAEHAEEPAARISAPQNRSVGEVPLRGKTGFCSQKKEIRFMSSQASSGCKHLQSCVFLCWFRALGQNAAAQLNKVEHTDGVGE